MATQAEATPAPAAENVEPAAAADAGAAAADGQAMQQRPISASLYVGDLDPEVGESLLFDIFKQVGPVVSIRVCRDTITRRSLGYAYVNFHNVNDAERAIDTLNYSPIRGRPCRIMWSHRDPSIRRSGLGNIYIKDLDASIDNKTLYDTFSTFGNILSCKVEVDEMGNSKGYGYVHYETQEAADLAIKKVNGMLLNDRQVYVGHFIPKKDRRQVNPSETFTNVYVKNFDETWSDDQLKEKASEFGEVDSAVVMKDSEGKSRGFGFINYKEHESAQKAVEGFASMKCGEKSLFADRAQKKSEREAMLREKFKKIKEERMTKYQGVNLYIKNLDDALDEEKLAAEFASFGTITSTKIMTDERGASRGFGFVCFSKPEEASNAVNEMNNRMINGKPIYVALAQPLEVRRAQLEATHSQRQQVRMQQPGMVPNIYGGASVYYPGQRGRAPMVGYAQQMRPWPPVSGGRAQNYHPMPNYVMPSNQRSGRGRGRGGSQGGNGRQSGGRRGVKYNQGRGNQVPRDGPIPGQPIMMSMPMEMPPPEQLTARLTHANPEDRKQILGDYLFPLIAQMQPTNAAKITGMILESSGDAAELLYLIEEQAALTDKVEEAVAILKDHQENGEAEEAETPAAPEQ